MDSSSDRFLLGFMEAIIVGVQHHNATVRGGSFVVLLREPCNTHDANAIQGQPIGYIERAIAAVLSPLIDNDIINVKSTSSPASKTLPPSKTPSPVPPAGSSLSPKPSSPSLNPPPLRPPRRRRSP